MRAGVIQDNGLATFTVNTGIHGIIHTQHTFGHLADMCIDIALLAGVMHLKAGAAGFQSTMITDLATRLRIKRCLFQNHDARLP